MTEGFLPGFAPRPRVKKARRQTDVDVLVEVWKDIEGIRQRRPEDVVAWNKHFYGQHARACKALLDYLGCLEDVERCMEDVVRFMRGKGKAYSISTVVKWMDRWKFKQHANGRGR